MSEQTAVLLDGEGHPHDDHECGHTHLLHRAPWLRALVLGANDGLISVASLLMGVSAATQDTNTLLLTGISGLAAGAASMAVGEYISVSSQRDTEQADIAREAAEHTKGPEAVVRVCALFGTGLHTTAHSARSLKNWLRCLRTRALKRTWPSRYLFLVLST